MRPFLTTPRAKGIPVNIVDDPQKCDFILPSLVERGDLTIACGTGGNSPALARYLREELENVYGEEYANAAQYPGPVAEEEWRKMPVWARSGLTS